MSSCLDRVVVVGTSCAGKSTFAQALSTRLGHEYIELDALHWGRNWQPKPQPEFSRLTAEAAECPTWVAAGNYRSVRDILWPRATTIVWLNYGFLTVLWRALSRTLRRGFTREKLWHGNRESLRRSLFSRDSILVWVITTYHRRRRDLRELRASGAYPHLSWIEFRRPSEAAHYLRSLHGTHQAINP
jgi:adenylate kinase family enzyme